MKPHATSHKPKAKTKWRCLNNRGHYARKIRAIHATACDWKPADVRDNHIPAHD